MKRLFVLTLLCVFAPHALSAVAKNEAAYIAGTIARFNAAGGRLEGRVDVSDANQLVFIADRHGFTPQLAPAAPTRSRGRQIIASARRWLDMEPPGWACQAQLIALTPFIS